MQFEIRSSTFDMGNESGPPANGRPLHSPFPFPTPWIKVCGVRSYSDLQVCAAAGATHVGLNVWPGSPRSVTPRAAAELIGEARRLGLVPVVVHLPGAPVTLEDAGRLGACYVQVLQPPSPSLRRRLEESGTAVVEARRAAARNAASLPWGSVLLVDAHEAGRPGGTGTRVSEALARAAPRPFVLAGGLDPGNVAQAISALRPAGVDAASGLESAPGRKDHGRIVAYCAAAREAFEKLRSGN